jgi:hypothetical protein
MMLLLVRCKAKRLLLQLWLWQSQFDLDSICAWYYIYWNVWIDLGSIEFKQYVFYWLCRIPLSLFELICTTYNMMTNYLLELMEMPLATKNESQLWSMAWAKGLACLSSSSSQHICMVMCWLCFFLLLACVFYIWMTEWVGVCEGVFLASYVYLFLVQ